MLHCCTMVMFKTIRMICDGMKVSILCMLLTAKSKSSIIQQMTAEASLKVEFVAWHRNGNGWIFEFKNALTLWPPELSDSSPGFASLAGELRTGQPRPTLSPLVAWSAWNVVTSDHVMFAVYCEYCANNVYCYVLSKAQLDNVECVVWSMCAG